MTFAQKLKAVFVDSTLRTRVFFLLGILVLFRVLAAVPVPGVDPLRLSQFLASNQFLGLLNIFSGGGLSTLSVVMLGVGPYITGSIIMQLLTIMIPRLKQLYQEEGEIGRKKFTQYARLLTVPLALIQGFGILSILQKQGVIDHLSLFHLATNLIVITAGTLLLMWLGELISEFGVGNGVSVIIFAGIVAAIPQHVGQALYTFTRADIPLYAIFALAAVLVIAAVVFITEAERPLPITYAKRIRGMRVFGGVSTYLPLRLNQAGVIPIIFALSILLFPQLLAQYLVNTTNELAHTIGQALSSFLQNQMFYGIVYFLFVFIFTYFYTAVTFDPDTIADNLQKNGAFIPGVRPGKPTSEYIGRVLTRITLFGASFLGLIAILPLIARALTGNQVLAVGGTALLIVVSVVTDIIKKIDAQITMREY